MKPPVIGICVCLCLSASQLMAQYAGAIQQARRDSAQNDAEQRRIQNESGGAAPGQPAGMPAPAPAAPLDPAMQAALQNVAGLRADLAGLTTASDPADPSQKVALLNDLSQAAQGTNHATSGAVKQLAGDLLKALAGKKKLAATQQTRLAREIHALFNSARLTPAQQQSVLNDIQKILTDADVSLDNAVDVVTDLKAVVAQTSHASG
jgi:hypothetical protein